MKAPTPTFNPTLVFYSWNLKLGSDCSYPSLGVYGDGNGKVHSMWIAAGMISSTAVDLKQIESMN